MTSNEMERGDAETGVDWLRSALAGLVDPRSQYALDLGDIARSASVDPLALEHWIRLDGPFPTGFDFRGLALVLHWEAQMLED